MTAVPQFRAVHNEWNIECKVNTKMRKLHKNLPGYHFSALSHESDRSSLRCHVPLSIKDRVVLLFQSRQGTNATVSLGVSAMISMQQNATHISYVHQRNSMKQLTVTLRNRIFYDDATFAPSPMFKVWVGGLGEEGTRLELEVAFEAFGPVKNIWLAKNPPSFAFIEMEVKILGTT